MKKKLCLQAVSVRGSELLQGLLEKIELRSVDSQEKEKIITVAGCEAVLRCKKTILKPIKTSGIEIIVAEGILVADDKLFPLCEITIEYTPKDIIAVQALLPKIMTIGTFLLAEADLKQRLLQERGQFNLMSLAAYAEGNIRAVLDCHLPWQLFMISKAWQNFLQKPEEKVFIRQLRVKIRRFRSCLAFFSPLFRKTEIKDWQQVFREHSILLAGLRELDVALMTCARIHKQADDTDRNLAVVGNIEIFLQQEREQEVKKIFSKIDLNKVTLHLAEFLLFLQRHAITPCYSNKKVWGYEKKRLQEWVVQLENIITNQYDFHNMKELHKIRIKVKRFRYVLQCLPEIKKDSNLMRKLKSLQDTLGFLHDDFINARLVKSIFNVDSKAELRYEAGLFSGWERAKAEAAIEALPEAWEDFCIVLRSWYKENLNRR